MAEEILRLKPNQVVELIQQGKMEVVQATPKVEPPNNEQRRIEKAKQLFGEDFLGVEAIQTMESKLRAKGINVQFELPQTPFPYTEEALTAALAETSQGRARMVILRPEFMVLNGERKPVSILNIRELFKKEQKDRSGNVTSVAYDNNPFGTGAIFYDQDWYDSQPFAQASLVPGHSLPTKSVVQESLGKTWDEQQGLLLPGEKRREAVETLWDTILYYAVTGKKLLPSHWDWTSTRASAGGLVYVGGFGSLGLRLGGWGPENRLPGIGVCPSR